jgi:hypothetical protein
MKQVAQNHKTGELSVLDVPAPACRPGGVPIAFESLAVTTSATIAAGDSLARGRPEPV